MAVEAELKALVREPDAVAEKLRDLADEQPETYRDVYFDRAGGGLTEADQELRVREIESKSGTRSLLTFKDAAVDKASDSKPEYETAVENAATMREIFGYLGYEVLVRLTKSCRNYRFEAHGRPMLATLVTVPEVDDTFIELETQAEYDDVGSALDDVRAVLTDLGIDEADLTTEKYTATVRRVRGEREG
ncbi:MAG TPA: class IV adenylate cyclase [Pseudonocardiaceae bacterium]|jgi:adenylate cyclase class 2|nr:class IV adenylate cyclase [Pseudonocardiaceae bacterium]